MREISYAVWLDECENKREGYLKKIKILEKGHILRKSVSGYKEDLFDLDENVYLQKLQTDGMIFIYRTYLILDIENVLVRLPDGQITQKKIDSVRYITVKELRNLLKMSELSFGQLFCIPEYKIIEWENNNEDCPVYVLLMMCSVVHDILQN